MIINIKNTVKPCNNVSEEFNGIVEENNINGVVL